MYVRRGMGYLPKIGSGGRVVDCDLWGNFFETVCWNPFDPGLPVKPAPSAPSVPASGESPGDVVPVLPGPDVVPVLPGESIAPMSVGGGSNWWMWIGIGAVGLLALNMTGGLSGRRRRYA